MASLIDAIAIKRKMFFEYEGAPYHCLDVEVSKPTARGGQTLVRLKMRNLLTRAVFDKTFKAGDRFQEPDLVVISAAFLYADGDGCHFMDQDTFETLTLRPDMLGDDRLLLADNVLVQIQKFNGNPIGAQLPTIVELKVTHSEPGVRGDTASRWCHQGGRARDGPRDPCAALHQGGREGEGALRDTGVCRQGVTPRQAIPPASSRCMAQAARCARSPADGPSPFAVASRPVDPQLLPSVSWVVPQRRSGLTARLLGRLGGPSDRLKIPIGLKTHPELGRVLEQTREPERRVRCDAALAQHNFVQAIRRDLELPSRLEYP
jgi:elongation factor P